jgi:hypothetical protein
MAKRQSGGGAHLRISPSTVVSFYLYPSKADSAFIGGGERAGYER